MGPIFRPAGGSGKSIFWSWHRPAVLRWWPPWRRWPMAISLTDMIGKAARTDWIGVAHELVPVLAARAAQHDTDDTFVADSYAELRRRRVFSAGLPVEL